MTNFTDLKQWEKVREGFEAAKGITLRQAFADDHSRAADMTVEAAGLTLD